MSGANPIRGGFDSHTFPPSLSDELGGRQVVRGAALSFAAAAWITTAAVLPVAADPVVGVRAAQFAGRESRPDVAPALLPEDWFGRPPSPFPKRQWQTQKSPMTAMLASFVVPGLGQLYNEREFWALVAAGVEFYFVGEIVSEGRSIDRVQSQLALDPDDQRLQAVLELHRDNRIQAAWLLGLTILVSGLQSFVDAHLFDFDDTPLPIEVGPRLSGAAAGLRLRF